jgi:Fe-Mn family superoxide dismutase
MSRKILTDSALRAAVNLQSSQLPTHVAKKSAALLSSLSGTKHTLPDLPYDYNALERKYLISSSLSLLNCTTCSLLYYYYSVSFFHAASISAETMEIHHSKHHNTYVTNLNATIEKIDSAMVAGDVSATIALQGALKFNGGGHLNHTLFWENLSPNSAGVTSGGALEAAITERFGSVEGLKTEMSATTVAVQGSGWGWLGYNAKTGEWHSVN